MHYNDILCYTVFVTSNRLFYKKYFMNLIFKNVLFSEQSHKVMVHEDVPCLATIDGFSYLPFQQQLSTGILVPNALIMGTTRRIIITQYFYNSLIE